MRIKKMALIVIPLLLLALASGDPAATNWEEEDANVTKIDFLNGLDYDDVSATQQMLYHMEMQIEERSGWINTTTHVNAGCNVSVAGNLTVNEDIIAKNYFSGDGSQGMTGSCADGTELVIEDGLVISCS